MVFRQNKLLSVILAIGVLGSLWAVKLRYSAERHNRAVEIAVDYSEVAQIAGATGKTVPQVLQSLKKAGVTSLAVEEPTLGELAALGQVRLIPRQLPGGVKETLVQVDNPAVVSAISHVAHEGLRIMEIPGELKCPPPEDLANGLSRGQDTKGVDQEITIKGSPEYAALLPVGIPDEAIFAARGADMPVVARMVNYPGVTAARIEFESSVLEHQGIQTVIFSADQVLGFRGAVDDVAKAFKAHGIRYGTIEFSKQKGDLKMSLKMMPDLIRVHSITAAEMGTMDQTSAVERFVKAARERNIRIAYVRMFDLSSSDPLRTNVDYIQAITRGLMHDGFAVRQAHPFSDPGVPLPARAMMALGVAAGALLLLASVVKLKPALNWTLFILLAVFLAGLAAWGKPLGLKVGALVSSLVFPTLAVMYAASGAAEESTGKPLRSYAWPALLKVIGAAAVTVAGGLMIAGLLARQDFMMHVQQFAGVKLSSMVPIFIVTVLFAAGIGWGAEPWNQVKAKASEAIRMLGSRPILIWQSVLTVVILAMVGLMVARSGNDSGLEVSSFELKFRSILDTLLFVRPRTKEFLIGHPAMFLAVTAALGGRRGWASVLFVIGTIGEISMLNTFCHIHTPIALSVIRSAIGVVLGLAIGVVLLLVFSRSNRDNGAGVPK